MAMKKATPKKAAPKAAPKAVGSDRTDSRGSTGFGKQGMGYQKGYSYTKQSGEKVSRSPINQNKPSYTRSQIVRNSDVKPKKKK